MTEFYKFASESPFLTFGLAWLLIWATCAIVTCPFKLINRYIRHKNIVARGWPTSHLDADGDFKKSDE